MLDNSLVLITGCAGFIGSHLINELAVRGVDVLGIDKAAKEGCDRKNVEIVKLDILNPADIAVLKRSLDKAKSKNIYLVHLMGVPDVESCEINKDSAYDTNVKSAKILWGLAEEYSIKKVVFPSTALVYGNKYDDQINEEFPPFPESVYACGKLEVENYLVVNSVGSKVSLVVLRLANVYGVGMKENTVANTILKQLKAGSLNLREYKSVRDYVYIGDVVNAFILSIFSDCKFKIYNVGSSAGHSVWELAKVIARVTDKEKIILDMKLNADQIKGGEKLVLCCDRIKNDLKWKLVCNLESGIKMMTNA